MTFRVYIACLAAYNAGILHGEWVEVSPCPNEMREEISRILKASPEPDAEEWAIHDNEGFGSYHVSEHPNLEDLCDHVDAFYETRHDCDLIDGVIADRNCSAREAIEFIDEHYAGEWESVEHWAEDFLEETEGLDKLPDHLRYYFDYSAYVRDKELNGEILTIPAGKGVHVLWNC